MTSAQKYYRVIFELMDWEEASVRCRELGTYSRLADINDNTENTAVKKFISSFDGNNNSGSHNNNNYCNNNTQQQTIMLRACEAENWAANVMLCYGQERPLQFANHIFLLKQTKTLRTYR